MITRGRGSSRARGSSGTTDHGALDGLSDDDHTQYLLKAGGAVTGNVTASVGVTFDGRDLSVDGAKLDGIETAADVTDAANVAAAGAVMDTDFSGGAPGIMRRTGTGPYTYEVLRWQSSSSTAPTANEDGNDGFWYASFWIDDTNERIYICSDPTAAGAVWHCLSGDHARQQDASGASATVSPNIDTVRVTYAAGTCTLTLPTAANAPIGKRILIRKENTGTNSIVLTPDSGSSINGGSTDATMTLPGSTVASSSTTADPAWLVERVSATSWRVS